LRTVIFRGFEGVNKVALDRGFKQIFGIGLKQAKAFTDELIESNELTFTNVSEENVVLLLALGDIANVSVEAQ
jgi:ribosomal protein L7/L12